MNEKSCFVVIPYGSKECEAADGTKFTLDFESVYEKVILPVVEKELGYQCWRSKDDQSPGSITEQMYRDLIRADLVIADTSQDNPNVYYELGIRHALCANTTILLRHSRSPNPPFDIKVLKYGKYDIESEEGQKRGRDFILKSVRDSRFGEPDSDVHRIMQADLKKKRSLAEKGQSMEFVVPHGTPSQIRKVGFITGNITDIKGIDVWVNSENTQMQMARFFERAVSASIRYFGSNRREVNKIKTSDDCIATELSAEAIKVMRRQMVDSIDDQAQRARIKREFRRMKQSGRQFTAQVEPHTVILTSAGNLAENGVKKLAHVAAVHGEPTQGFEPVDDIGKCVRNVLAEITNYNGRTSGWMRKRNRKLDSVLIPVFGTGQARKDPILIMDQLISSAIDFLKETSSCDVPARVLFLAHTAAQLQALEEEFGKFNLQRDDPSREFVE